MKHLNKIKKGLVLFGLSGLLTSPLIAQQSQTFVRSIASADDDAEETITDGGVYMGSSDLELMLDGSTQQIVGLRFTNLSIPQGATIESAFIQFSNKGDKVPVSGDVLISIQDADDVATFDGAIAFNISSRITTGTTVTWPGSTDASWDQGAAGVAGPEQRTPNVGSLLQAVVDRTGWLSGNSVAFILSGTGVRNTYSFEGSTSSAAKLIVTYSSATLPALAITQLPITSQQEWKYNDAGTDLGTTWNSNSFDDTQWSYGPGRLGFSDNAVTELSYGPDANNKTITYYFRKQFTVADVASLQDSLEIGLLRDAGAIVYINGTEVVRSNMPTGAIDYLTTATSIVDGLDETTYQDFRIAKDILSNGTNTIAVEIHLNNATSEDMGFDLTISEYFAPPPPVICDPLPATHISNFVSVLPSTQPDSLRIPSTHTFQMLVQQGDPYTNAADGVTKGLFDFTGYVGQGGSSENGYLSINHELGGWPDAGVSMLTMNFDTSTKTWTVTNNMPVDFGPAQGTGRNCSGTVTPWGTIITCEETVPTSDANADGYQDIGWAVEIDPVTGTVMDYDNDGTPDKIWGAGRMSHENVVVAADMRTLYEGNDENSGYIFKFVADSATDMSSGDLYVLKLNGDVGVATTGEWIPVPNSTPTECNNVRDFALAIGASNFNSVEDVEISPLDSMIYFTSKSSSRVYRFHDNHTVGTANDVINCEVFVGNSNTVYDITQEGGGIIGEQWRSGNDNLTFDNEGNLYVIQDGGRNHIWMVRPCHTIADPKVELFAVTPAGCEPTGMTLSPDNRFMFVSMQHPSGSNTTQMIDAAGNAVTFNKESAIVIARKEFLGLNTPLPVTFNSFDAQKTPDNKVALTWAFVSSDVVIGYEMERMISGGNFETIARIDDITDANTKRQYSYLDEQPYEGQNFYRIKTIQENGSSAYTDIRMVVIHSSMVTNAYPNPASKQFTVELTSKTTQQASIHIFNAAGTVVATSTKDLSAGANKFPMDISALAAGVYQVVVNTTTETTTIKMVKK